MWDKTMSIDWTQASTQRGLIWVLTAVIGLVLIALGKDPSQLLVLASGIAGGLGVLVKD
jgi:hypothetical protein